MAKTRAQISREQRERRKTELQTLKNELAVERNKVKKLEAELAKEKAKTIRKESYVKIIMKNLRFILSLVAEHYWLELILSAIIGAAISFVITKSVLSP